MERHHKRWKFGLESKGIEGQLKTESICVEMRGTRVSLRLHEAEVKTVESFKYLASTVQSNGE